MRTEHEKVAPKAFHSLLECQMDRLLPIGRMSYGHPRSNRFTISWLMEEKRNYQVRTIFVQLRLHQLVQKGQQQKL